MEPDDRRFEQLNHIVPKVVALLIRHYQLADLTYADRNSWPADETLSTAWLLGQLVNLPDAIQTDLKRLISFHVAATVKAGVTCGVEGS